MTAASELTAPAVDDRPVDRRWLALCIIALVQLMIVVDGSIVTVALPSMQEDLNISGADRQWVVTAYTLAFGRLLLLGGRIADYVGRKRMFVFGLIGFAVASGVGGLAQNPATLFAARAAQGACAALMAPAALSLLTVTFPEPKERARAYGVYSAGQPALLPPRDRPGRPAVLGRHRRVGRRSERAGPSHRPASDHGRRPARHRG